MLQHFCDCYKFFRQPLTNQALCWPEEEDEGEVSAVMAQSVTQLLSVGCFSLIVTQGWRRICSRVGRSDGCWLRHQPISCSHSETETQGSVSLLR